MLRPLRQIFLSFLFLPVMPLLADGQGHFENFSIKENVSASNGTIVSKFSLDGTQIIIVRALGPSLARHGVANPLMDPILELHNATGAIIASDDNWPDKQLAQFNGPYRAFQPPDRREAAIVIRLEAGSYTAVVRGKSGGRGVASAEVYSASVNNDSRVASISSRALVLGGGNALVGTLTVAGNSGVDMIVRALGPSLARSGITNFLRDPTLALYDHTGRFVRYNDNWRNDQAQAEEIMASGLAPAQPAEAAMSVTLAPGTYTVVVRGSQNSTGVGSFEAYRVRQHQVKPSPTPTPVPAPSPTATPTPTSTPSPAPSLTPAPTATPTPFPTPTPTPAPTQTPTPTATPTSTPTPDATATPGPSQIPHGVFSLVKASGNIDSDTLTNPSVDGISLREHWCDLEPSEGVFDWSYFDSQIARAAAAGKDVLLRVVDGGDCIPVWVMSAVASDGGSTFTFSDSDGQHVIPVFWDATFLAKKEAMIAAVGSRYTNNPAVKIACASFANAVTGDWNVPSNQSPDSPYTISEVSRWFNAGYTTQKMLDAGKSVIDATMQAFPNQLVLLAINSNGNVLDYPHDNNYVAQTAAANARLSWGSDRLIVSKYNLSNKTPTPPGFGSWTVWYDSEAASGAQALWSFYGDTTYRNSGGTPVDPATGLERSIDIGMSYGMKFMEIYQIDVVNLPEAINYAHNKL